MRALILCKSVNCAFEPKILLDCDAIFRDELAYQRAVWIPSEYPRDQVGGTG